MKRFIFIVCLSVYTFSLPAQSVSEAISNYVSNINHFTRSNPQEKVWLHFDNTGYYLGETIWFKAYVVNASDQKAAFLSKVLYVELLTPQGEVIDTRKLKIEDGQCRGEFPIKKTYRSGFYEVRAYTRSMLNFGDDCMFSRVFPVYDDPDFSGDYADKKMDAVGVLTDLRKKGEKLNQINLAFYPEGGHAVMGVRSRIAFKVTGKEGQDMSGSGAVYNAKGDVVAAFHTIHQGMGVFELTPEESEYKVTAECEGKKQTFSLSGFLDKGYVMQVDNLNDKLLQIRLEKSVTLPIDTLGFTVSCRGMVYVAKTVIPGHKPYTFRLSKSGLPAGCLQLTLVDREGKILSERLVFNAAPVERVKVEVKPDKSKYRPLERVQMELNVKTASGEPLSTTFSLAVRDAATELHTAYEDNILTDLLLASDVKGYIENPFQYFRKSDRALRLKLDLLMLVQGWRRYDWQLMAGLIPFEVKYYAEEGLDISGKILEWSKDIGEEGVEVTFWMNKDGASLHGRCKTDEKGFFHFLLPDSVDLKGKWPLRIYANRKGKRKHCRILLDRSGPQGKAYSFEDIFVKDTLVVFEDPIDSLKKRSITEMQYLKEVVVRQPRGSVKPDISLDVEKDINIWRDRGEPYFFTVGEYLAQRVTAIDRPYYKYGNGRTFYCYSYNREETRNKMRGVFDADIEGVFRINIYYRNLFAWKKVAIGRCLDAPPQPAVFIMVLLYDDGLHDEYQPGIRQTFYNGYSQSKAFFHQDNSKKLPGEADFRRTLYWNPDVKTDEQGKAKISFYNNSSCKHMTISAEGITSEGVFILGD